MAQIIDGFCDFDNVLAEEIARHNISMYGSGDYVLQVDECLGYELVSNNEIHIKDGLFITQGRRGYIKKGTTDICTIENGAQAVNRNDIVVIEYAKDEVTMLESHTTKIIKGVAGETAVDPELVTGDINAGAILHQMPLYRVKIEGLNVAAVEQLFEFGSVAAETVDPMLATEEGFAADAKLTGDAIGELHPNYPVITDVLATYKSMDKNRVLHGCSWNAAGNSHPSDTSNAYHVYTFIRTDNDEYNRIIVDVDGYGVYLGRYNPNTDDISWSTSIPVVTSFDASTGTLNLMG